MAESFDAPADAMATLRAEGVSFAVIAATLNKWGFKGPQGGRWYGATVRRALEGHASGEGHRCTARCREQERPCIHRLIQTTSN
ncbi:MAG: recombinase family protein [Pseudomonadota bacterium]